MDAEALLARLQADGMQLAVAESCTGGLVQSAIVAVPGASKSLLGGVVAYSDAMKTALLGVDAGLIASAGAVSASVCEAMAHGIRERTGADVAIAVTGVAGPSGGGSGKPVGTVWIAVLGPDHTLNAHRLQLEGDRAAIRATTVTEAFRLAHQNLDEWEKERA